MEIFYEEEYFRVSESYVLRPKPDQLRKIQF